MADWQKQRSERDARLNAGSRYASGMFPAAEHRAVEEFRTFAGVRAWLRR